jgi:hypothetical protein
LFPEEVAAFTPVPVELGIDMPDASEKPASARRDGIDPSPPGIADALRESSRSLAELMQYVSYLVSTKLDQLKLSIRMLLLYAVLAVVGAVAAASVLVVSVVLLLIGLGHGLGSVLGGRDWLGDVIISLIVLCVTAFSLSWMLSKFKTASRRRTMRKYEERRKQQGEWFGHDFTEDAK